jgi:Na+/melibiose symporter-like transporter
VLLVYALVQAPNVGWGDGQTIGLLITSVALVAVFARVERRAAAPLVPLRIFKSAHSSAATLVLVALGMVAWGMSLTVSLYAQRVLGFSALEFGLGSSVMTVGAIVGSATGQAIVTRIGYRAVAATGIALTGAGCLLLTQVSAGATDRGPCRRAKRQRPRLRLVALAVKLRRNAAA